MVISKYLDVIERTGREDELKEGLTKLLALDDIVALRESQAIGEFFKSIEALANAESIAKFRESKDYDTIKDWSIYEQDLEKGELAIYPGPKHAKIALAVAAAIGAGICFFIWHCRRRKRRLLD